MNPQACTEVLDILKYVPKSDYDKIPADYINWLYQNSDETSTFSYNAAQPFDGQPISKEAKQILAEISQRYWQ